MCGLISFSGQNEYVPKWIELLILWNSLERGEDSTGIFSPNNGLKKSLDKGSHFVLFEENKIIPDNIFIGHVRARTVGVANLQNAHPFQRGNYTLAHNGTLTNHWDLARKYELTFADYSVDSDILCGSIEKADKLDVIKEINGAAALIINDNRNPEILYVFRNDDRPLFRAYDNKGGMYISSLKEPLFWLGLKNVKEFKSNILYSIKNGEIIKTLRIKNTPLIVPSTTTTYNNKDAFKFTWLRAKNYASWYKDNLHITLVKDKYYLCKGQNSENELLIELTPTRTSILFKNLFNISDVIVPNDLVICLKDDIKSPQGTFIGNKGNIFSASTIHFDGDLSINNPITNKFIAYARKDNFRKLTAEELEDYLNKAVIDNQNDIEEVPFETEDVLNEGFDITNYAVQYPQNKTNNNETNITEDLFKLEDFINKIDNDLEELNTIANTTLNIPMDMKMKIVGLIDYIVKERDNVLPNNIYT